MAMKWKQSCWSVARRVAAGVVLIVPAAAWAWGPGGHMIAAKIAYDKIAADNPKAKAEIDRLLAVPVGPASIARRTSDFVNAAHWADDIKHTQGFEQTADEHFIDFPFAADKTALPGDLPKEVNIVKALSDYVDDLKSEQADDATKAQALRFIIHLVGDIHQPLHCATRVTKAHADGDRGGNDFTVTPAIDGKKVKIALHSYWDRGLGAFPKEGQNFAAPPLEEVTSAADAIKAKFTLDPKWQEGGPFNYAGWAKESVQIATTFVYQGVADGAAPSATYAKKGTDIAQYRVLAAGNRLAALLTAIWQ
jgi:hypothetical protein